MATVVQSFEFHKAQYDNLPAWSERNPPWCQSSMWLDCARVSPLLLLVGGKMSDPGNKAVWGTWRKIGWGCAVCFTLTLFMTAYYDFPYPIYNLVCIINNSPAIFLNLEPGTQPKLMQAHYHFQLWTCMHRNRNPCNSFSWSTWLAVWVAGACT